MAAELIISASGIRDRTLFRLDEFHSVLDARGVPLSLFVAPRLKGDYRLERDAPTVAWLHERHNAGDAVVLHGFDEAASKPLRGEFAALGPHEANLRLIAADRMLEHAGLRTRLFAAPRWTASEGTVKALPRNGFRLLIGLQGTVDLVRDSTKRSWVLGIGAGFLAEPWWCRTLVQTAERTARRGGTVRIGIAARHLSNPAVRNALTDAIDLALMHGCRPAVYRWDEGPVLSDAA